MLDPVQRGAQALAWKRLRSADQERRRDVADCANAR